MTGDGVWDVLKSIGSKAWGAVGVASAFVSLIAALFYKDVLKDADVPPWVKDFTPVITFVVCIVVFSAIMLISRLVTAWARKRDQVHIDKRETVIYRAYPYKAGSDLRRLSEFAHTAFHGDTMGAEMVQYAVKNNCALGLRLTDPDGRNVGFLDAFHFTDAVMEKWKMGTLAEDALRKEDFRKIPAKGQSLDLAVGAIYVEPSADKSVAPQFASLGESFMRKRFAKFHRVTLYATIFKEGGETMAGLCRFKRLLERKDRGRHGNTHEVWSRTLVIGDLPHTIGGVGGRRHVVIEFVE